MGEQYTIGIEITYDHFRIISLSTLSTKADEIQFNTDDIQGEAYQQKIVDITDEYAQRIANLCESYIASHNIDLQDVVGVGIAIVATFRKGTPEATGIGNLPIYLKTKFPKAVVKDLNRSTMSAWYEYHFGARQNNADIVNLLYLTMSKNINIGNVVGGFPNNAGAGKMIPHLEIPADYFAQQGIDVTSISLCKECEKTPLCFSNIASGQALVDQIYEVIDKGTATSVADSMNTRPNSNIVTYDRGGIVVFPPKHRSGLQRVDAKAVVEAARQQDAQAMLIIRRQEAALAYAINSEAMQNLSVDMIVIGGIASKAISMSDLQTAVNLRGHKTQIKQTKAIGYTALFGAALYARP